MTSDIPVEAAMTTGPYSVLQMDVCTKCTKPEELAGVTVGGYLSYCVCSGRCWLYRRGHPHRPHKDRSHLNALPAHQPVFARVQESCAGSSARTLRRYRSRRTFHLLIPYPTCKSTKIFFFTLMDSY